MAYDPDKIFGEIRNLLESAPNGTNPSRTEICQRLVDEGVVRSMGTAHKYVGAFFAADSIKAEIAAPDVDTSVLPERVYSAFVSLLDSAARLKNEVGAAMDDLTHRSSTAFAKIMTAHDLAQQAEIVELATELETIRADRNAMHEQLLAGQACIDKLNAVLEEKDATLAEAAGVVSELRSLVADRNSKIAAHLEVAGSRDRPIGVLESEREARQRNAEKAEEQIRALRQMRDLPGSGSEVSDRPNPDHSYGAVEKSEGYAMGPAPANSGVGDATEVDFDLPTKPTSHHPQ